VSNINTAIRYVPDARPNERLIDLTAAYAQQDNAAVLAEAVRRLKTLATEQGTPRLFDTAGIGCIGLIGEYGPVGYGIRRAQEVIRVDRTPSYWSHAFVIATALSESAEQNRDLTQAAWIWESSLDPTGSFTNFAGRYGAGARRIAEYNNPTFDFFSPHSVPNIAVIAIGLTERERADLMQRADHPDVDQLHYDLPALLGSWFGYLSNRADRRNPLSEGQAEYSAAYVQLGYEAAGLDLADIQADHLAHATLVRRIGDHQRLGAHVRPRAHLDLLGVKPQIGVGALQRALAEDGDVLIERPAQRRDTVPGHAGDAQLLDQAVDLARGDAVDIGLLHDRHERCSARRRGSKKLGR